jgi:hypothetical protein
MSKSNIEDVAGYIQETIIQETRFLASGWCFHKEKGILPLRISNPKYSEYLTQSSRNDVCETFQRTDIEMCGWLISIEDQPIVDDLKLEMFIDEEWRTVFDLFLCKTKKQIPSFVVMDNFYEYPDKLREFALTRDFEKHPNYHKGERTNATYKFPGLKERFEEILGHKITNWNSYGVNGCFQFCVSEEKLVYHVDVQQYAGIIYLTPDAPPNCGTTFYRSKNTKNSKLGDNDFHLVFGSGFYDSTQFDVVDQVGNKYNRLVLFDAQMIHAASCYFGNEKENSRLFQMFFFDLE